MHQIAYSLIFRVKQILECIRRMNEYVLRAIFYEFVDQEGPVGDDEPIIHEQVIKFM